MNGRHAGLLLFLSAMLIWTTTGMANSTIVINGSFESGSSPGGYTTLHPPSAAIDGWIVTGNIDYIGSYWTASDGGRSLDLNAASAGGIRQDLATVPGAAYLVQFDLAGNPAGGPTVKEMEVSATGSTLGTVSQVFSFDATGANLNNMGWSTRQWGFTAADLTTTLAFESAIGGAYGPALDRVIVTQVTNGAVCIPAPGAILLGALGAGLVGWMRRRRTL